MLTVQRDTRWVFKNCNIGIVTFFCTETATKTIFARAAALKRIPIIMELFCLSSSLNSASISLENFGKEHAW